MKNKEGIKQKSMETKIQNNYISETEYLNKIFINNIDKDISFTSFSFKKLVYSLKEENYKNILISMHYLCNSKELFNNMKGQQYFSSILYIILFIIEADEAKLKNQRNLFLNDIVLLIEKLFLSKIFDEKSMMNLIKFISYSSIYDRREINLENLELLNHLSNCRIRNYERFKLVLEIIKRINCPKLTYDFCLLLKDNFFGNKANFYILTAKIDLLELLFIEDEENKIMEFLCEIYSFKYNSHFIGLIMDQIKETYDIKNKNNNSIEILHKLNKSILFMHELQKKEEKKYSENEFLMPKSFIFNDNRANGIYLTIPQIQISLAIVFSFCYSPSKKEKNTNEIPLMHLIDRDKNEKNGLSFLIKEGHLYFKNFFNENKVKLCEIDENQAYLCYYSIKEKDSYSIQVMNKDGKVICEHRYKFIIQLKKNNVLIQIGKYNQQNFEGFMGPVLIFKSDIPKNIFALKGYYEKALFYQCFNTNEIDMYDYISNTNPEKFLEIKKTFYGKDDLAKNLMAYITPAEEGSSLNKLYYYNTTFVETKISFYKEPKAENEATYFVYNKFAIFEFLKYEGMDYITLIFELITSNIDNMNEDNHQELVLNIFRNIINYLIKVIDSIDMEYYTKKIRNILFSLEKCVVKICQKTKMTKEMSEIMKLLILFLNSKTIGKQNKKSEYFIYMRNEICKFILNTELYDLANFYPMQCILDSINNSIIKNKHQLTTMEIFRKIMSFTIIFNQDVVPKKNELMHSKEFKSIKHGLIELIINYLFKCDNIQPFNDIFYMFSNKFDFDYRNYQYFKIFYLVSELFFKNENNKNIVSVLKYLIDLYEYLDENKESNDTLKKERNIVRGLCITIFLENTINEYNPKMKEKKLKLNIAKRFSNVHEFKKLDLFDNYLTQSSNDKKLDLSNDEMKEENKEIIDEIKPELNDIIIDKKHNSVLITSETINKISQMNFTPKETEKKINDSNENNNDNKDNNENNNNNDKNDNNKKEINLEENVNINDVQKNEKDEEKVINLNDNLNINNFKTNNTEGDNDEQNKNNNENENENDNDNDNEINKINTNEEADDDNDDILKLRVNQTLNYKISEKNKYYEYFSFALLYKKLVDSNQFNDYCFKSLVLFFLEKNNNVTIPQKIKYKFIIKTKQFKDLEDPDYQQFLKISYFNEETKEQFSKLLELLEKNTNNKNIRRISYEIMIYLIVKVAKERPNNECTFRHFISSRKICCKIFLLSFLNNKDSADTLLREFQQLIELIMPYHKEPFILSFLYTSIIKTELIDYGKVLINTMLCSNVNKDINPKLYYKFKINSAILLYRIIKSKEINIDKRFNILNNQGLQDLFVNDLLTSKNNVFKDISNNRRKTYAELLYEILMNLYIKTKDKKFIEIAYLMFVDNKNIKKVGESKTILYYLDNIKKVDLKGNNIFKIFKNNETLEDKYFTLSFLYKSLKYWMSIEANTEMKNKILEMISLFFFDAKLFYKDNKSRLKKLKGHNELFNYVKIAVEDNSGNDNIKSVQTEAIVLEFRKKYKEYQKKKKEAKNSNNNTQISRLSLFKILSDSKSNSNKNDVNDNIKKMEANDSFSSCNSSKSKKARCANNKKRKIKFVKKKNITEILENEEEFFNFDENKDIDTNAKNKQASYASIDKIKNINQFRLDYIDSPYTVILFPKLSLLEQTFATYFTDVFFYNRPFINMKHYFKYKIKKNHNKDVSIDNYFDYPIITRNYIPNNLYFGGLFIKHDLNFFANRYFHISHHYFIMKAKESKRKRIFPKISEQNDILKYVLDINDTNNITFIVELITNRSVYFGELIIGKNLIYFHSIDKDKFLKGKSDEEVEKYLLSSQKVDYSNKNKKLFIFKKEITEIINRRFLYLFQACEFYLKNGKSYYFNFYSEDNKINFFSLFSNKENNPYNIKIISDLKTEFKKKDYTNQWLKNKISTLEYLLFINKYSCRSYNDINQYPVFPWVRIIGNKIRDLKNTIAAQTEDSRMMLREKYTLSSETFPFHYTTHYSNASFLLYYLVRINPFTDNQITLQDNKFDSPGRQFNSIDELLKILSSTSQPREIIPEFFVTTEFFYNYNCNFFGIKNKKDLINNLENKSEYKTPLDYVLSNATRLELPECKNEINYFFDNVFGVGQMGGQEKCNTYDKYSYQEMIDLRSKISKYIENKMPLKEIKMKIESKSNKIISFGQTPFKLLEDKHPQWVNNSKNNDSNNDRIEATYTLPSSSQKIIFINKSKSISNKKYIYILTSNNSKEKANNYEIKFFEQNLKEDSSKLINIQKKLKFFTKLRLLKENKNSHYLYRSNPKFIVTNFNMSIFILCRFNDSSFYLTNLKGETKFYLTESIVTCLTKSSERSFFTGHINGKVIEWTFKTMNNIPIEDGDTNFNVSNVNILVDELSVKRRYIAHTEKVSGIYYSELLGLIITSGDDHKIMIRKYYDLTLLTMIDIGFNKFCVDIKVSHCFLYILFFDESEKKHIVQIYSINGLKVGEGSYNYISGINIDKNGNVLIGNYKENKIEVYNPALIDKLDDIDINVKNDKKENEEKLLVDFMYEKSDNYLYCCFSNGQIIKKKCKNKYESV